MNVIQKRLASLMNVLQKFHKAFQGFLADLLSFTRNLMQARCSVLLSIADKIKHEVGKHCSVTWLTDALGL